MAQDYYFFDRNELDTLAQRRHGEYVSASPFPHIVMDDFVPEWVVDRLLGEFPEVREPQWNRYDNEREKKLELHVDEQMGPFTRHLVSQLNSATFIGFLEQLTGVDGLVPDPHLWGGGLHQIERGGLLKVHADFNWHEKLRLDRRLNLLLYLNRDWHEAYGGELELWERDMSRCVKRVSPVANRCVVFSTTDHSMHGHPDPLRCPENRTRRSLALYYYSNGRPREELSEAHSTLFKPRPGETWRRPTEDPEPSPIVGAEPSRWVPPLLVDWRRSSKHFAELVLPPAVTDAIRARRRRPR